MTVLIVIRQTIFVSRRLLVANNDEQCGTTGLEGVAESSSGAAPW
jgi:hypothetical protein